MVTISTREQLAKMVDANKDLSVEDDVLFEFSPTLDDIRNVKCRDLTLKKDGLVLDFNGWNFTGGDFNGGDFNGGDFNGGDFNGGDFNGRNFTGGNISYYAFFCSVTTLPNQSRELLRIRYRCSVVPEPIC